MAILKQQVSANLALGSRLSLFHLVCPLFSTRNLVNSRIVAAFNHSDVISDTITIHAAG